MGDLSWQFSGEEIVYRPDQPTAPFRLSFHGLASRVGGGLTHSKWVRAAIVLRPCNH